MSAVGTIPDNEDKRPPDIIADRQIQRAATDPGTFTETPPPRLPQLPVVVPPNIEDVIRDISLATFRDQAKTITINGQTPEVTGGKISFEIPTQPPASAQFTQLNPPPPLPLVPIVQPPVAGSVTTLQEMEAASAARNAPKTSAQRRDEEMDEVVARKLKADPDYKPSALASNEEKEAYQRATNPAANPSGFSPTQLTPQLQQQLVASVTPGATGVNWLETKGTADWDVDKNKPKFGLEKNRLPGETRSEQEDREEEEYRKQKKEYREKVRALEEERPGQRSGEGVRAYTERTNENRLESMSKEETAAVANGDSSYFYKGFIPILFTRKDGNRKILARLDNTHSVVIEGATGNERQGTLPPENGYYEASGGDSCVGLALYIKTVGTTTQVWIGAGTVAGQLPLGFDPENGKIIASGGSGNVWAEVNINGTTGAIVSIDVDGGGSTPNNTDTSFYYPLGYYEYDGDSASVTNYGCGSLDVTVCRLWYASEPPYYELNFTR